MNIEELAITLKILGYRIKLNKQVKSIYLIANKPIIEVEDILLQYTNFSFQYRYKFPSTWMWIYENKDQ